MFNELMFNELVIRSLWQRDEMSIFTITSYFISPATGNEWRVGGKVSVMMLDGIDYLAAFILILVSWVSIW